MSGASHPAVGTYGPAKVNATRRCAAGQTILIKAVGGASVISSLSVGVYDDAEQAKAVAAFLLDPSDTSLKSAHDDALSHEVHEELNITISIFKAMCADFNADFAAVMRRPVGGSSSDPLVGTKFTVTDYPVVDFDSHAVLGLFNGEISVDSAHSTEPDKYNCSFEFDGNPVNIVMPKTMITRFNGTADVGVPLFFRGGLFRSPRSGLARRPARAHSHRRQGVAHLL